MKKKESEKLKLNLNDLSVESFDTMPEGKVIAHETECFHACDTGCDTVVCVYPTADVEVE